MNSAYISEIYASVQGEGPFTGERQVFVRLAGCPLRCRYCDTPGSLTAKDHPRVSLESVLAEIGRVARKSGTKTVSVTGGEPLAQPVFLKSLFEGLRKGKYKTYLETAGVHSRALRTLVSKVDVVSMDMKLPSATGKDFWKEHIEFLKIGGKKIFVKVVIEKKSKPAEIQKVVDILSRLRSKPLLILQPATPIANQVEAPTMAQVADAYGVASSRLQRVLVMPQQHKIWGVR